MPALAWFSGLYQVNRLLRIPFLDVFFWRSIGAGRVLSLLSRLHPECQLLQLTRQVDVHDRNLRR